jgi:hypothetical protein
LVDLVRVLIRAVRKLLDQGLALQSDDGVDDDIEASDSGMTDVFVDDADADDHTLEPGICYTT